MPPEMVCVSIDTTTEQAKKFVALLATFQFAKIIEEPNAVTMRSIEKGRKGKTRQANSLEQLFTDLSL